MKKEKKKCYYLHTIDDHPGTFDGWQVCFATWRGTPNEMVESLAMIRKQQKISKFNREQAGFENDSVLGHMRFTVSE